MAKQGRPKTKYVYFIESAGDNKIKIGMAHDVSKRIKQLQTGNPDQLNLIRKMEIKGNISEKEFRNKFKSCRVRGEWFERKGKLDKFLNEENDLSALKMIGFGVGVVGIGYGIFKAVEWLLEG